MAIAFTALVVRHERRIRLLFSQTLSGAAFGVGLAVAALYVVACTDGSGANPGISAAIPVAHTPNGLDLALNCDLVEGGVYTVTTNAVPGADSSVSSSDVETFTFGALAAPSLNVESSQVDIGALVYGLDLVHSGSDFVETAAGDLDTVSGVPNVQGALNRRLIDEDGIPWDPTYGAKSADYVNGPAAQGSSLVGALRRQAIADDRVESATVKYLEDPENPGDEYFPVTIALRGDNGTGVLAFPINVPAPGGQ